MPGLEGLTLDGVALRDGDWSLDASLRLPAGGVTAVIGPSGAGKSTLLSAIAGFVTPSAGRILWQGRDLTGVAPHARPVSILFQDGNLFPHLTLAQNVALALRPVARPSASDAARVAALLARMGLGELADRRPGEVSGGQAARAALARVLIADRPLVLLDEPFAALGPALKAEMADLAATLLTEALRTVLVVTHDPAEARRIAPAMVVVAEGRVSGPFPTAATLDNPPPALAAYLGA